MQAEIELPILKFKKESKKKTKNINDYSQLIKAIKKDQLVAKENKNLKKIRLQKVKSYKNQQQSIEHNKKAMR